MGNTGVRLGKFNIARDTDREYLAQMIDVQDIQETDNSEINIELYTTKIRARLHDGLRFWDLTVHSSVAREKASASTLKGVEL